MYPLTVKYLFDGCVSLATKKMENSQYGCKRISTSLRVSLQRELQDMGSLYRFTAL